MNRQFIKHMYTQPCHLRLWSCQILLAKQGQDLGERPPRIEHMHCMAVSLMGLLGAFNSRTEESTVAALKSSISKEEKIHEKYPEGTIMKSALLLPLSHFHPQTVA